MEWTFADMADQLFTFLETNQLFWTIAFGTVCLVSACLALGALFNTKKGWESFYFVCLCGAIFFWAGCELLYNIVPNMDVAFTLYSLHAIGLYFLPAMLCLNVWKQVSYKEIRWYTVFISLLVPVALSALLVAQILMPQLQLPLFLNTHLRWDAILYIVYTAACILKSYLLCFNVFYQMPRHMRRSAYYMLAGLTVISVAALLVLLYNNLLVHVILILAMMLLLFILYSTFSTAPSANVIVTSRDFVFGSLSTLILVLSRRMYVLDWNKKNPGSAAPLPEPKYKETFQHYRNRMVKEAGGRISPHDNNIITILKEGKEQQYFITTHEVKRHKRHYGYIVEISEITSIYSVLRYFEEIAIIDQLTGLYNRNAYLMIVPKMLTPENMPLAVIVGDVNNLKRINDTYGHLRGDALLSTVSNAITASRPPYALTARIGGDEFVVLIPKGTVASCNSFIAQVEEKCRAVSEQDYGSPSISWGYAIMTSEKESYNDVFARADAIMYESKKAHFNFRSSGLVPPSMASAAPAAQQDTASDPGTPSPPTAGTPPPAPQNKPLPTNTREPSTTWTPMFGAKPARTSTTDPAKTTPAPTPPAKAEKAAAAVDATETKASPAAPASLFDWDGETDARPLSSLLQPPQDDPAKEQK